MYKALPNLRSSRVTDCPDPSSEWKLHPLPKEIKEKDQYKEYCMDGKTESCFISTVEGMDPNMRVSKDNPPMNITGLIVDYDSGLSKERFKEFIKKNHGVPPPNFVCDTFTKDQRRLIWEFEEPLRLGSLPLAREFFKVASMRLKWSKWLPGFDDMTLDPTHFYHIGKKWERLANEKIPRSLVLSWAAIAAAKVKGPAPLDQPNIPLDVIAELVEEKFPGRWNGPFVVGARGLRFWDPSADNETAAVVSENGMHCFTGPSPFVPWVDIFGMNTLDEHHGDGLGTLRDGLYYHYSKGLFYMREEPYGYVQVSREDLKTTLNVKYNLSKASVKGQPSEIDKFLESVQGFGSGQRVDGVMPFVYTRAGLIEHGGKRILNDSEPTIKQPVPMASAEVGNTDFSIDGYFRQTCPFLHGFLTRAFDKTDQTVNGMDPSTVDIQLNIFLAYLARKYRGALVYKPPQSQVMVIGGHAGVGKTMLVNGVIPNILGTAADGTGFLVDNSQWTAHIVRSPVMLVDDSTVASDDRKAGNYTANVKKLIANSKILYQKKYGDLDDVPWFGSVFIACNLDPQSSKILPDLEETTRDKVIMLKMRKGLTLNGWYEIETAIKAETPFFARFLLEWEIPSWCYSRDGSIRGRFGIHNYHHEELAHLSMNKGGANDVLELLRAYYDAVMEDAAALGNISQIKKTGEDGEWVWKGRPMTLLTSIASYIPQAGRISDFALRSGLDQLISRGLPIEKTGNGALIIQFGKALYEGRPTNAVIDEAQQE